ncbi:hypothetical protein B0H15DRAFT_808717 [Mycena belliarum]|uniref:Uncharacterized protein n=1 Tax=Mycena belliarum TaxID=1033014 RepID=A0AAD6UII8_9AGAR|nr:hypothetical protein B0H15DRAFT_808717 [Mycena belliae]
MPAQYSYPIPSGVQLVNRVTQWPATNLTRASFPYSAEVSFDFPLPAESLLVLSHGPSLGGDLQITTSSAVPPGSASVHIIVNYHHEAVRDTAKVGLIKRKAGETGLGIFTPMNRDGHINTDNLFFNVKFSLPRSNVYINNLTTDVSNFAHNVDRLEEAVKFGEISLKGSHRKIIVKSLATSKATLQTSNALIDSQHLVARNALVQTSNGKISGNFHVSDSLYLRTSNGVIKTIVGIDGDGSDNTAAKTLTMCTTNSTLESTVSLETSSGAGGHFRIETHNSNGSSATRIASLPIDGVLLLESKTTNAPTSLTLPPAYEGGFTLSTSNALAHVSRLNPNELDPAGLGRQRVQEIKTAKGSKTAGGVYWDKESINRGHVTLKSSNGPASIHF